MVVRGGGGGGGRVVVRGPVVRSQPGVVVGGGRGYVRERYYDHGRRPGLIVESYGRRPGYYWVGGSWQWDGREWIWVAGRYEVDPNYGAAPVYYQGGY